MDAGQPASSGQHRGVLLQASANDARPCYVCGRRAPLVAARERMRVPRNEKEKALLADTELDFLHHSWTVPLCPACLIRHDLVREFDVKSTRIIETDGVRVPRVGGPDPVEEQQFTVLDPSTQQEESSETTKPMALPGALARAWPTFHPGAKSNVP